MENAKANINFTTKNLLAPYLGALGHGHLRAYLQQLSIESK